MQDFDAAAAVVCTQDGNLTAWLRCFQPDTAKTVTHHVPGGRVSRFHSCSCGLQGFAAAAATQKGGVQVIFGTAESSVTTTWLDPAAPATEVRHTAPDDD